MRRLLLTCVLMLIAALLFTINAFQVQGPNPGSSTVSAGKGHTTGRDSPPDLNIYVRKAIPEDYEVGKAPSVNPTFLRDTVISNTDATLTNTDTFGDSEPTIAINPANPNEIVISAFSGGWGSPQSNAPIWHSTDGGNTWTKQFTVPVPTGLPNGCPCDQAFDYGRGNRLSGTFLKTDVYSGTTTNPASGAAWGWFTSMGVAVRTNSAGIGSTDQPWLLVIRDTVTASQDNVYSAYDDFSGLPRGMRVAVAKGSNPPNFTVDNSSGTSLNCIGGNCVNPGHRLTVNPNNGYVYSLFQDLVTGDLGGYFNLNYMLNRSTDSGATWGLNGSPTGVVIANADSTQASPKFGTVNALLGGIDHAAVDPSNGDVYYVYGTRDSVTLNNRLAIIRLTDNGMGGLTIGAPHFLTGQVQAALPSVAVTTNGTVGVLYTTYDGMNAGFPQFTAHFATSTDQGSSFMDNTLLTFLSSAADNGDSSQRVLGDYQQVKAVGTTFYGVFTGNGAPLGRPFANHDAIFFKVFAGCTGITCPANVVASNTANQCQAVVTYAAPTSSGDCGTISCAPSSGSSFPVGVTTVTCTSQAGASCSFTVTVNDTEKPTITCPASVTAVTDQNQCPSPLCTVVNYPAPVAMDNCPGPLTTQCTPASGSCFPVGVTTVTCTATDTSGNVSLPCTFTVTTFDVALQDDSNPSTILLWNSITGQYRFCCNGITFTGIGKSSIQGCVYTLQHNPVDRRVLGREDKAAHAGSASIQAPPGNTRCTITDRNTLNDTNLASCQ